MNAHSLLIIAALALTSPSCHRQAEENREMGDTKSYPDYIKLLSEAHFHPTLIENELRLSAATNDMICCYSLTPSGAEWIFTSAFLWRRTGATWIKYYTVPTEKVNELEALLVGLGFWNGSPLERSMNLALKYTLEGRRGDWYRMVEWETATDEKYNAVKFWFAGIYEQSEQYNAQLKK